MSGLFGVIGKSNCVEILFYGTDYHSHLGTSKGGIAVFNRKILLSVKDISTSQFKSVFLEELERLRGKSGVGVISDKDIQPVVAFSSFGTFAVAFSGLIQNKKKLVQELLKEKESFSYLLDGQINSAELIAKLIAQGKDILEGIKLATNKIEGSASLLILTKEGIYCARDKYGRTPLLIGQNNYFWAVASETTAFPNLGFIIKKELKPGEIVLLSKNGAQEFSSSIFEEKICSFLWIYTGYPASSYDSVNVELVRERCGMNLAKNDKIEADFVTGIPDSGIAHALGYAQASKIPYRRALVKYTPGYGRSYTPPSQKIRNMVAKMKLVPIKEVIKGKRIVICDDSIVRGTQLKNQAIEKLWYCGAKEIHVRIACPPLIFPCKYCLSTRTNKELAAIRAVKKFLKKSEKIPFKKLLDENSSEYKKMVENIRRELGVTTLKYQTLRDMIKAIGLPEERLCLYCWQGR